MIVSSLQCESTGRNPPGTGIICTAENVPAFRLPFPLYVSIRYRCTSLDRWLFSFENWTTLFKAFKERYNYLIISHITVNTYLGSWPNTVDCITKTKLFMNQVNYVSGVYIFWFHTFKRDYRIVRPVICPYSSKYHVINKVITDDLHMWLFVITNEQLRIILLSKKNCLTLVEWLIVDIQVPVFVNWTLIDFFVMRKYGGYSGGGVSETR